MNSLLILPEEGWGLGPIHFSGARAAEIFNTNRFQIGQELRIAQLGGDKGLARVVRFSSTGIDLEIVSTVPSLALRPIDLVVGLARPQTIKKVIQAATMSGVRSLHLVHTESGEKSYLTSHLLEPESLRAEVIKSLEQIWEGTYPSISVHRSFRYFANNHLMTLGLEQPTLKIVASPHGTTMSAVDVSHSYRSMVIAVGSEGGWSSEELKSFCSLGFKEVGLGPRVVRVEVALLMLLGQSALLGLG